MPDPAPPPPPDDAPDRDFVAEYRKRERDQRQAGQWHKLSGAGVEFAVAVALFAAAGYGVDRWLDIAPWGILVGVAAGFAVGLYILVRASKSLLNSPPDRK